MLRRTLVVLGVIFLASCASGKPKTVLIDGVTTPEASAIVHPTAIPGGLMLIQAVDGKSTYIMSIGFMGSIYVPPGTHEFEVEVSHTFKVQDAGGPAWTVPAGVSAAPLVGGAPGSTLLLRKGISRPRATLEAGKTYELRFGFDRTDPVRPVPVTWVSQIPG
jgi:hypothetical protein